MKKLLYMIGCGALMLAGATARAQIVFDFSGLTDGAPAGAVGGSSYAITKGAFTLTASGYNNDGPPNTSHNLFRKQDGGDEHGLGLTDTTDNELTLANNGAVVANYIQIDISQIYKVAPSGQLRMDSTTDSEESYDVWGSNTAGSFVGAQSLVSGGTLDDTFFNIPDWGSYKYIDVTVHPWANGPSHANDNVLVGAIACPSIPEPTSFVMVGLGLGLVGFLRRRAHN